MNFQFRDARRSEAKPLIGLYSESGRGKTYSSLLLARGFVGDEGKIGMIETESGRGEAYADIIPGGYQVLPIRENFAPAMYGQALTAAEAGGLDALIIDSASHEWEGAGGVLAMAAARQAAGTKGVLVWQQPKMDHQRHFMLRLMQTPIPLVIVCMRAKYPMVERKKPNSEQKEWVRSDVLEPKQADDILFEMFIHGWIDEDHRFRATKYTRPDLAQVIRDKEPISIETGRALAAWARGEVSPQRAPDKPSAEEGAPASPQPPVSQAGAPDIPPDHVLAQIETALSDAAENGEPALREEWETLAPRYQNFFEAALRRRHKPRARQVDAERARQLAEKLNAD